jgi:glycosyltransferase involved in cell wall biosynthesis
VKIALDATYSVGRDLSGVGVYSREILDGLAKLYPEIEWRWLYRPHRLARALKEGLLHNAGKRPLFDKAPFRTADLFHGLNQRLPKRRFRRQIATFHDLFVMTAEYSTPEFRKRFAEQARHAAAESDHIIAVSEFTAGQIVEFLGVERQRITVIHHGVREFPRVEARREKIVLHVGAIQKRKNLVRLVEAFRALPESWRLVLAGSSGFGAGEVFQTIQKFGLDDRAVVTGYLTTTELAHWLARASIFAFPSLDEGFGMPVLEAMSAGLPVVASRTSAVGEVAGTAALLVNPIDTEEIAFSLKQLADDEALQSKFVRAGYERAALFSWRRAAEKTFRTYSLFFDGNLERS